MVNTKEFVAQIARSVAPGERDAYLVVYNLVRAKNDHSELLFENFRVIEAGEIAQASLSFIQGRDYPIRIKQKERSREIPSRTILHVQLDGDPQNYIVMGFMGFDFSEVEGN